jgi:DNA replication protein DnaC
MGEQVTEMMATAVDHSTGAVTMRVGYCACGAQIPNQTAVLVSGRPWGWSPLECEACQAKVKAEEANRVAWAHRRHAEDERRYREERIKKATAALDVPPLYAGVSFETWKLHGDAVAQNHQAEARQRGRVYLHTWPDVPGLLVLRGAPGTGKGHWAWSVARDLTGRGVFVTVVKLGDLVRKLRASWRSSKGDGEEAVLRAYRTVDLLVIDEVSRHAFYGENVHQHLYDVIDNRLEWNRPTILTSNEDEGGLRAILRDALWDRLFLNGGLVEFGAASYRREGSR